MKYSSIFSTAIIASVAMAAYVPSDPWTTLTPDSKPLKGASTNHPTAFGIQIKTIVSSLAESSSVPESASPTATGKAKRGKVDQIGDGQVQQKPSETLSTIVKTTAAPVNQIGDGQIQHRTAAPVNQIGDGQIQHQTAAPVNQIDDGQIQHQTANGTAVNQINDGQIQHQTAHVTSHVSDGQVQETGAPAANQDDDGFPQACLTENSLTMKLKDSVLTDSKGRIGAIVANRQFQFDGPPPQAGSIYAAGWSITQDGFLALGDKTIFYQCMSGDFYNLYDENVAEQCSAVHLGVIDLVTC